MYFNSTSLTGNELGAAVRAAQHQDDAVLAIMRTGAWSPSQVWQYGTKAGRRWLLTSVRRSISNLTDAGLLEKTGLQVDGCYGRREHTWVAK